MSGSTGSTGSSGPSGPSGGNPAPPGNVYISSAIDIKGVPDAVATVLSTQLTAFLAIFVPVLLSKSFRKTGGSFPNLNIDGADTNYDPMPELEIGTNISFTQIYTDVAHPYPGSPKTKYRLDNGGKRILLRRDKSKRPAPLLALTHITSSGPLPFEIQIRSSSGGGFATTAQVDYILYYLAKVGYFDDKLRIQTAFYNVYVSGGFDPSAPSITMADLVDLEITFTPPVQIGINDQKCNGYSIPGSDKRTAIAVLHDRVECLHSLIQDITPGSATMKPILTQYVAYDHGLIGDLSDAGQLSNLPKTPVDWYSWYATDNQLVVNPPARWTVNANNPTAVVANDLKNLSKWVSDGNVLVFASPLGAGTLSIFLTGFPFSDQETSSLDDADNKAPKDGAYIRLCNGNNPYSVEVNATNGISAYDDRFIFYDKYYRVLANLTPGESVRVTWCASQPIPAWISIVGT